MSGAADRRNPDMNHVPLLEAGRGACGSRKRGPGGGEIRDRRDREPAWRGVTGSEVDVGDLAIHRAADHRVVFRIGTLSLIASRGRSRGRGCPLIPEDECLFRGALRFARGVKRRAFLFQPLLGHKPLAVKAGYPGKILFLSAFSGNRGFVRCAGV